MGWIRNKKNKDEFDQKNYPDVMVDLETLSTSTDAVVLSIGAVRFRMETQDDITSIMDPDRSFYARLDTDEQEERGRDVDPETMKWWGSQNEEARAVFKETPQDSEQVLKNFFQFCKGCKRIWGNGNMFDNAIIRDMADDYGLEYPVPYYRDLDVRTLTYLWNLVTNWGSKGKRPTIILGEEHNALDDARRQVLQCQIMFSEIKGSKYGPQSAE